MGTLGQFKERVACVILMNAGVKLAVKGSPVLDQLRQLEQIGVRILACGTCLNHFWIMDRLEVGSIPNMYAVIEVLMAAGKVIRP